MLRIFVLSSFLISSLSAFGARHLILVGGGNIPQKAIERFVELSGGPNSKILVITWASDYPKEAFDGFKEYFNEMGVELIEAPRRHEISSNLLTFQRQLSQSTGVFFTGGDQSKVMSLLDEYPVLTVALRQHYLKSVVFGGTSAGTALMSEIMITGGGDETIVGKGATPTRGGLGLLSGVIVDQHFIKRKRLNRLISTLLDHPEQRGLGIDEDSAVEIINSKNIHIFPKSQAIAIVKNADGTFNLKPLDSLSRFSFF